MLKIENITSKIGLTERRESPFKSVYTLEPLYAGYGHTIGNALRRVLLSSIPGCAVKGVKIEGVVTEFSTMEGVKENVVDILMNFTSIILKSAVHGDRKMTLSFKGPGTVTAKDIEHDNTVKIINPDLVIATLTKDISFNAEIIIGTGEGFVAWDDINKSDWDTDTLPTDALYSPITNVSYSVEDTMVGRMTNFDKLTLNVESNGSVETKDAISYAVELLMDHFKAFYNVGNRMTHLRSEEEVNEDIEEESTIPDVKLEDLDLSVRPYNCLKNHGVKTLRDIAKLSREELQGIKSLGSSSLKEIDAKLEEHGVKRG